MSEIQRTPPYDHFEDLDPKEFYGNEFRDSLVYPGPDQARGIHDDRRIFVTSGVAAATSNGTVTEPHASDGSRILGPRMVWFNTETAYTAEIDAFVEGKPRQQLAIFARYLTEDDLLVGAWSRDGRTKIQVKTGGVYQTVAEGRAGAFDLCSKLRIGIRVCGRAAVLKCDVISRSTDYLHANDIPGIQPWGAFGIRTDGVRAYLTDWWAVELDYV